MKYYVCIIMILTLASCSYLTVPSVDEIFAQHKDTTYDKYLETWIGHSENDVVEKWGPPSSVYKLADGSRMLTFEHFGRTVGSSGYIGNGSISSSETAWCKTSLTLNTVNVVTRWHYDGNSCFL